jgi:putative transcriptional regulator
VAENEEDKMKKRLANRIIDGLTEAVAHARGEAVPNMVLHVPASVNVKAIRKRTKLSQPDFASTIGVALGTLRGWEQHRREPVGPARVLLALVERNPRVVEELLSYRPHAAAGAGVAPKRQNTRRRRVNASARG